MDFLISKAWAEGAAPGPGGDLFGLAFPLILLAVFYFLLIRPQQKRAKEHKGMLEGLKVGDEVITGGGIAGKVSKLNDGFVSVEVANGVEINVQKPSISTLLPKGSLKKLS